MTPILALFLNTAPHAMPLPAMMLFATQLTHLAPVDVVILLLYFAMVIFIGF